MAELLDGSENKSKFQFQFQSKVSTLRKEDELALMLLSPCRPKSRRPQAAWFRPQVQSRRSKLNWLKLFNIISMLPTSLLKRHTFLLSLQ